MTTTDPFMFALLWTCTHCGFVYEGGQPKMECQFCGSYKTAFIDMPQHLEKEVREEFPELPPNHRDCRKVRLSLMKRDKVNARATVRGRVLPATSGTQIDPSNEF